MQVFTDQLNRNLVLEYVSSLKTSLLVEESPLSHFDFGALSGFLGHYAAPKHLNKNFSVKSSQWPL